MKKAGFFICLALLVCSVPYLAATDYYVANTGSDGNSGRSQQSPWRTIGKVNSSMGSFNPGDNIYFKGGDTFSDTNLFITCEGSPGNPVTFGSYGTGRPKFNTKAVQCGHGSGYITVDNLEIYNTPGDGITFYKTSGWQYDIVISNCYVHNTGNCGIIIQSIDGYLIKNCKVHDGYNGNIYVYGSDYPIKNGVVQGCVSYDAIQNDGICIHEGDRLELCGSNHLIVNCVVHGNAEEGFDISDGANVTLRNCVAYGDDYAGFILEGRNNVTMDGCVARNGHHGIHVGGSGVTIKNCLVYDNDFIQVLVEPYTVVSGIYLYNNTLVHPSSGNSGTIIQAWNNFSDMKIKNNIIMTKGTTYPTRMIGFGSGYSPASAHIEMDNNCYYHPGGSSGRFVVGNSVYSFSSWKSTYNHESHSLFTNPILTNPSQNDYSLTNSSPCVDAGANVGNNTAFGGISRPQGQGYDIGAYEQTGGGTPLQAGASASPASGQAPLTTSFSGEAWGGTAPYTYHWAFGDGGSSTQKNPSHTYSQSGTFTATFTVTDNANNQNSDSVTIRVNAAQALSAGIVASPNAGKAPLTVAFTGTVSGGVSPFSFRWAFGDGGSSTLKNPSHTYSQAGTFTATFTVTDNGGQQSTASVTIQVSAAVQKQFQLNISITTGQGTGSGGGTISPSVGIHFYDAWSILQIKAKPNKGFRFSRWIGDIREEARGKKNPNITMYADKTLTALFCSICGDVNGDGYLSPLDSQAVFDIFLGRNQSPSVCQKENGDVNGDGTQTDPYISAADAQAIFIKYLGKKNLPCDCSYNVRTNSSLAPIGPAFGLEETATPERPVQDIHLGLEEFRRVSETEIQLPVMINDPHDIDAFGFDLSYPAEMLEFTGVAKTDIVKDFYQVEGHADGEGMIRVGGYSAGAIESDSGGELVILIFKLIKKGVHNPQDVFITQTYDDVANAYYLKPTNPNGVQKSKTYVRR